MTIDLSSLLRGDVDRIDLDCAIAPDRAPDGIRLLPGASLKGTVTDLAGYVRLESTVSVPYEGECSRCLAKVRGELVFSFDRTLVAPGVIDEGELEENAENYLIINGGAIDPDSAVSESVLVEFPMVLLCSPDCPGLCPHCGKKLGKEGRCDCFVPETDPRWAKLKEIEWD